MYRQVSQVEEEDLPYIDEYRDALSGSLDGSIERFRIYYEEMDERDSIYLDAVSLADANRKSLYLSRQTIYHSAEDLGQNNPADGSKMSTQKFMNDERLNGDVKYYSPDGNDDDIPFGERRNGKSAKHYDETWCRFQDGTRTVDFVLAYRGEDQSVENVEKRRIFQQNLIAEGLEVESENSQRIHFVKIHVPKEVLCRYCEIMKMKMPIIKLKEQDRVIPREFNVKDTLISYFKKPFKFVIINRDKFEEKEYELQHEFSRDKSYLFDENSPNFFTPSLRIAVCNFILERQYFTERQDDKNNVGIRKLLSDNIYLDAYPLHDGNRDMPDVKCQRNLLLQEWASINRWIKHQPLDHIKEYFGVKIALYFAWLGFYTHMLISASIVGLICFLYGLSTYRSNRISEEICNDNQTIIMCPRCDAKCDYWYLSDTCTISRIAHMFDNNFTIVFAVFMSIWATLYLEMWKRYSADIQHRWGITDYCHMAEHPRAHYLARLKDTKKTRFNVVTGVLEPSPSFWRKKFPAFVYSYSVIFLFILLSIAAVFGIVIYRMSITTSRNIYGSQDSMSSKLLLLPATAAVINLIVSTILNYIYDYVAVYMTEIEYRRTQTEYDDSLSLKIYLFQFLNYYSSIFYIAFMKGKFPGYPAKYNRIFSFRQEECSPGGCLMELCIQLAIIMTGKQIISAIAEIFVPYLMQKFNAFRSSIGLTGNDSDCEGATEKLVCCNQWTKDYNLIKWTDRSLFEEYLKMIIQYGFITIFVVAFPLGPLFALLNNIFETRLDAKKFILYYKRAVPARVRNLGIWYNIMHVLGKIAVISSAFIIAFSSNFIPRLAYMYVVNKERNDVGFVNHTLAVFKTTDFEEGNAPMNSTFGNVEYCRYAEYRNPPWDQHPYKRPLIYWHILALRLAFVVIYQNVVSFVQIVVAWAIPDQPSELRDQILREQYLTNEFIIEQEKKKAQKLVSNGSMDIIDEEIDEASNTRRRAAYNYGEEYEIHTSKV